MGALSITHVLVLDDACNRFWRETELFGPILTLLLSLLTLPVDTFDKMMTMGLRHRKRLLF